MILLFDYFIFHFLSHFGHFIVLLASPLPVATMSEKFKTPPEDLEATVSHSSGFSRFASLFGGSSVWVGPRIAPLPAYLKSDLSESEESSEAILNRQLASEDGTSIQYRTCSWQKTAALLFSEYICLAIMSFPWSYSVLGLVPGLILTVVVAALVLYTSLVLWEFCLRHPEVRDVCDIGQMLFWGKEWAWWLTAIMFVLNNTFIQALHVLVGAEYLNTMTASDKVGGCRTVEFGVVVTVICLIASLYLCVAGNHLCWCSEQARRIHCGFGLAYCHGYSSQGHDFCQRNVCLPQH